MNEEHLAARLRQGAAELGLALPEAAVPALLRHLELLLKWNRSINLTAVTDPLGVIEKHFLDSLAVASLVPAGRLLDAGTGGGFPGVPIKLVRADVEVVLVDSVGKKVAFLKTLLADLKLSGAKAVAVRLEGHPERESLPPMDAAVARAFSSPEQWLALAQHYVRSGGLVLALAGPRDPFPASVGRARLERESEHRLPFSGAVRRVGVYRIGVDVPRGTQG